jgi:hypothetical protein
MNGGLTSKENFQLSPGGSRLLGGSKSKWEDNVEENTGQYRETYKKKLKL